jgi:hypothetical protein
MPRLMATPAPTFSAVRIWRFHRTFQGIKEREISIMALHTTREVSFTGQEYHEGFVYSLAWNRPYRTEGLLSIHSPGKMSTNVLANGLHCTQGITITGTANIASVAIAK